MNSFNSDHSDKNIIYCNDDNKCIEIICNEDNKYIEIIW